MLSKINHQKRMTATPFNYPKYRLLKSTIMLGMFRSDSPIWRKHTPTSQAPSTRNKSNKWKHISVATAKSKSTTQRHICPFTKAERDRERGERRREEEMERREREREKTKKKGNAFLLHRNLDPRPSRSKVANTRFTKSLELEVKWRTANELL